MSKCDPSSKNDLIQRLERYRGCCTESSEAHSLLTEAISRLAPRPCRGCDCDGSLARVTACIASDETSRDDARDAARYRFLRQPGNAIVYAKDRNAWGKNASGHVAYKTAEQLDAAVDAARGAEESDECRCGCHSGGCGRPDGCRCGPDCPCQQVEPEARMCQCEHPNAERCRTAEHPCDCQCHGSGT